MIGLFASDLDGTLYGAFHKTNPIVLSAIRAACDSGRHFAVATGRTMRSCDEMGFAPVPIEAVCANGAIILDRQGRVIHHVPIDREAVGRILSAFPEVPFDCISLDHTYVRIGRQEWEDNSHRRLPLFARISMRGMQMSAGECVFEQTDEQILRHDIVKLNCHLNDADDPTLSARLASFLDAMPDQVINAPFASSMFEITNPEATKANAVAWLAGELGLSEDEVAVYGDGGNDIAMLCRFPNACAPRGAQDAAKAATGPGHVLGSNVLYAVPRHVRETVRREGPFVRGQDGNWVHEAKSTTGHGS